jgi:hypothetical protein
MGLWVPLSCPRRSIKWQGALVQQNFSEERIFASSEQKLDHFDENVDIKQAESMY